MPMFPLSGGEVGNPPTPDIIKRQPKWAYYVIWAGMARNTTKKEYEKLINDSHVLCLEDYAYRKAIAPYRLVSGLYTLPLDVKKPVNFSGEWKFDEDASTLGNAGTGTISSKLEITQNDNELDIKRTMVSEYSDNTVMDEPMTLDGKEKAFKASFGNAPRMVSAHLSANGDTIFIYSKVTISFGGRTNEWTANEVWTLSGDGDILSVKQSSGSFQGKRTIIAVYKKE